MVLESDLKPQHHPALFARPESEKKHFSKTLLILLVAVSFRIHVGLEIRCGSGCGAVFGSNPSKES